MIAVGVVWKTLAAGSPEEKKKKKSMNFIVVDYKECQDNIGHVARVLKYQTWCSLWDNY